MNAHPAGPRHAEVVAAPHLAERPNSPEELAQLPAAIYPQGTGRDGDGVAQIGGIAVTELAQKYGTPLFVINEEDFRARCAEMAKAFGSAQHVHYASKAFLSTEVARWVHSEGLSLDVCSAGELTVALHAGFPADRIALHGNNKSPHELELAVTSGVGHVVLDSVIEIERLDEIAGSTLR